MIEIELNNIIKNYGLKNVLNGMNLTLKTGERAALIGCNGAGKSTVFKIIMKQENISAGTINIRKNATIGMLKQIYEYEETNPNVYTFVRWANKSPRYGKIRMVRKIFRRCTSIFIILL